MHQHKLPRRGGDTHCGTEGRGQWGWLQREKNNKNPPKLSSVGSGVGTALAAKNSSLLVAGPVAGVAQS